MLNDKLSRICFGCEALGGTDWGKVSVSDIEEAISVAIELGVNFFDTAGVYGLGLSEKRLSNALGVKRHDITIATKGGLAWDMVKNGERATIKKDSSAETISRNVFDSLNRLRVDRLSIFYVHWPDKLVSFEETFDTLTELQSRGLIGSIGVSNFSNTQLQQALKFASIDFVQVGANLLEPYNINSISDTCFANEIKIVPYNVLASGLLMGKFTGDEEFPEDDRRSRLPLFEGEAFHDAVGKVNQLRRLALSEDLPVGFYAVSQMFKKYPITSSIIGIKNKAQIRFFEELI